MRPNCCKSMLAAIGIWQICAIAMTFLYGGLLSRWVALAFVALVGPIQVSYGAYERTSVYLGYMVVAGPATLICLRLFDQIQRRRTSRHIMAVAFLGMLWTIWSALITAYEYGISYKINQLFWSVFGPPSDLYSFRNLMLHRIVTWFLCTIPTGMVAIWVYSRMTMAKPVGFPVASSDFEM